MDISLMFIWLAIIILVIQLMVFKSSLTKVLKIVSASIEDNRFIVCHLNIITNNLPDDIKKKVKDEVTVAFVRIDQQLKNAKNEPFVYGGK